MFRHLFLCSVAVDTKLADNSPNKELHNWKWVTVLLEFLAILDSSNYSLANVITTFITPLFVTKSIYRNANVIHFILFE